MRINHNIAALNTYRQLIINNAMQQKSLVKLSSGLRINSAADDAAGLAISEKMRGQIRGLEQASRNAQDGISMIQTAEGGLNEVHSILQRMRELAVQASSDTNTIDDRAEIQKEIDQLVEEIDRIGNSTEFNTKKLLNGQAGISVSEQNGVAGSGGAITVNGNNYNASASVSAGDLDAAIDVTAGTNTQSGVYSVKITAEAKAAVFGDAAAFSSTDLSTAGGGTLTINGVSIDIAASDSLDNVITKINNVSNQTGVTAQKGSKNGLQLVSNDVGSKATIGIEGSSIGLLDALGLTNAASTTVYSVAGTDAAGTITDGSGTHALVSDGGSKLIANTGTEADGIVIDIKSLDVTTNSSDLTFDAVVDATGVVSLQIGSNNASEQQMNVSISDMRALALGINNLDVTTAASARTAIDSIDEAIKLVSAERSKLGAYQNRLEHTINNLGTSAENLTASESRIRDVDMAKEMMEFTKLNILAQAAQAMLERPAA